MANDGILKMFNPPGYLDDLSQEHKQQWSDSYIGQWTADEIAGRESQNTPLKQYFNPTKTAYDMKQKPISISWFAFPNRVSRYFHALFL